MKKIIIGVVILGVVALSYGAYMYFKPNANMKDLKSDVTFTAQDLFSAFETDEAAANTQYLDKVIEITGEIKDISTSEEGVTSITLEANNELSGVICQLQKDTEHRTFKTGETVTFKGMCTGMLMDVVLVRCVEK